jgi:hypothetical protein
VSEQAGIDGTPAWAYDEDGYCVCCGNGRWKHHMAECQLRDALDAVPIVRALANVEAGVARDDDFGRDYVCGTCDLTVYEEDSERSIDNAANHDSDCPWRQAVEWAAPWTAVS